MTGSHRPGGYPTVCVVSSVFLLGSSRVWAGRV